MGPPLAEEELAARIARQWLDRYGIVTRAGKVALSVEGRGRRVTIASWMQREDVDQAKELLSRHLRGEKSARYLMLPDIRSS